jgi:ribosomal protein S18 acetylase RimI-like enzyme
LEPIFQRAQRSDGELLLELMREFYPLVDASLDESCARAALERLLADVSLGAIWLVHYDDQVVGYVVLTLGYSLEFHGRDAYVDELYIRAAYQGRGLGTSALRFCEEVCRTLGIRALHLEVDRGDPRALAVYQRAGFEDRNNYLLTKWVAPGEVREEGSSPPSPRPPL